MYQASEHRGPVIYSTDQRPQPKTVRYALSIKLIAYASAMVIIALFLAITIANLILAKSHYQTQNENGISQHLSDKAQAIEAQLAILKTIVTHVAAQPTTQDILEYKDVIASQAWALQMRRFLPQALGVALITPKGKVLGEPAGLKLAPQCLTDMAKISQHESTKAPAIHQDREGTLHFDLTATVRDDAENPIGMLFVSFGIDSLKDLLSAGSRSGEHLVLSDGYGSIIAEQDNLKNTDDTQQSRTNIAGTDWQLSLVEPASGPLLSFLSLAIFNVSAFLLTVGVIAFLVSYIMRSMGTDFTQVKTILNNLADDELLSDELPMPKLRETAEVLPAISHIHRNIDKKQQLLDSTQLHDKLTGLSNRRQFNIEFARAYDFARRGTPVCVVLMHLDGINRLNEAQISQVVKVLGKTLKEHARKVDHASRLGLDEFALLMFGATPEGTTLCLERLERSFEKNQMAHPAIADEDICTLNCGYTRIHAHRDNNAAEVLKRAEAAVAEACESSNTHIVKA